jgi:hypothetical protein
LLEFAIVAITTTVTEIDRAIDWQMAVTNLVRLVTGNSTERSATVDAGVEPIAAIVFGIEATVICRRSHLGWLIKFSVKTLKLEGLCLRC